ncbi:hypothetical protein ACJMK2_034288 [Sinanodonta woodiana]|uniref:Uncharacterized protein n=1 Tax=Sinanodonta woodiana TaxID=1069815 RepID=A0ABD3WUI5_SINWO
MLGILGAMTASLERSALHQEQYHVRNVKLENISRIRVHLGARFVDMVKLHIELDPLLAVNACVVLDITMRGISVTLAYQGRTKHLLTILIAFSATLELTAPHMVRYHVRNVQLEHINIIGDKCGASFVTMRKPLNKTDPPLSVIVCPPQTLTRSKIGCVSFLDQMFYLLGTYINISRLGTNKPVN